ncbi:hypothetical protein RMB03_02625 [Acinetobacter sp. V91_7]|uniref:hypothetical protein n=1 Tax=unclassified Acinetobacter TaxID=196816 RepID=UPI00287E61B5|nr:MULTISPECIES: hypothetical protein [unclassified Acinetobacter]MDS7927929.1 hypothetical protein [Acinetobacter sp. V102_4]MDS7932885.1 hypothetical protein [Acinetobacter sp. V91_4B]MDS7961854.1 hypothetical protein [Acinetobacter sp. V91_7]MDS8028927.1 hypothetical protein [Acinetobacter sp. V91_13]
MKTETKEILALELTKIKIANESKDSVIDASFLISTYIQALKEIEVTFKAQKKAMKIDPKVLQEIKNAKNRS